jgi:6-phosphogluconolactonase
MRHPESGNNLQRRTFLAVAFAAGAVRGMAQNREWLMYVGTYTAHGSKGIYVCRFGSTGKISAPILAAETSNPSFLTLDSNRGLLYAANENDRGTVSAFSIDRPSGKLKPLNSVSSKGAAPCHVALDGTGKWLFVANYNSGSVAVLPVLANGALGDASNVVQHSGRSVNPERQTGPHAHMVAPAPNNRFLLVPDLGLDQVMVYRFDAIKGALTPNDPPFLKTAAGFGPRHLAFGKGARFVYVLGEMAAAVTVFRYDAARGAGEAMQTISMLPEDYTGTKSGAEIAVDASGKFLYASNRGHDSIAIFRIDSAKGTLTAVGRQPAQVKTPRNFAIDPTGAFLLAAGQDSDKIASFGIDQAAGSLKPSGEVLEAPSPVCIVFAAAR